MVILNYCLSNNIALVLFDFRASGFSTGKYVSLGWFEALDINIIVSFLIKEIKVRKIILWGRSMGGVACIFFMSPRYRQIISKIFNKNSLRAIEWTSLEIIKCLAIDSAFVNMEKTIHNMCSSYS